jgi:hypothetical protein
MSKQFGDGKCRLVEETLRKGWRKYRVEPHVCGVVERIGVKNKKKIIR